MLLFYKTLLVPQWLIFKAFWDTREAEMAQNWLKMDTFHLFVDPKCSKIKLEKRVFDPFLVPERPIFKAFWDFFWGGGGKRGQHVLKSLETIV